MIALFFMSIPITENQKKLLGPGHPPSSDDDNQLMEILQENIQCNEIKLQLDDAGVKRIVATQNLPVLENMNIEKLCRQYTNQDVLIKIRNGKKITVERTRIIST